MKKTFTKKAILTGKSKQVDTEHFGTITLKSLKAGTLLEMEELKAEMSVDELQKNKPLANKIALLVLSKSVVLENGETFTPEELLELDTPELIELFSLVDTITELSGMNVPVEAKNKAKNFPNTSSQESLPKN